MLTRLLTTAALAALAAPLAAQDAPAATDAAPPAALNATPPTAETAPPPAATGPVLTPIAALPATTTTARQRIEPIQSVPLSVTPIAVDDFRLRGSGTALPVLDSLPNTVAVRAPGPGGATSLFIRGLGSTETLGGIAPAVGTFVDGITLRQDVNDFGLFDIARIDAIRGSQGVLFGRNTSAGAIDVTLARPGDRIAGNFEAGYGQYGRGLVRGSIDLPAGTGIGVKLSGYYDDARGVTRNSTTGERINDRDRWGLRGAVRLKVSDALSWNLAAAYLRDSSENMPDADCDPRDNARCGGRFTATGLRRGGPSPFVGLVTGTKAARGLGSRSETQFYTSHLDYALGDATFSAITGYVDTRQRFTLDFGNGRGATGGNVVLSDADHRQFSQELRLAGTLADGRFDYIAGAVYFDDKGTTDVANVATSAGVTRVRSDRSLRDETEATAGYLQLGFAVTPALKVSGGVRYTDEDRRFIAPGATLDQSDGIWTPHAAISLAASDAVTLYASATRGYRSGGWNARAVTPATLLPYATERAWTYEAGAKTQFWEDRLRVNLTGFWLDVRDAQVVEAFSGAANGGKLRSRGVEIEVAAVPITGLSLTGSAGYQDAEYRDTALQPAYAPELTASAGISYDFALPPRSGAIIVPSVIARYRSSFETTSLTPTPRTGSSVLVDAGLAVKTDDGNWTLGIECLNCLDQEVVDSRVAGVALLNAPRAWLVRARRVF